LQRLSGFASAAIVELEPTSFASRSTLSELGRCKACLPICGDHSVRHEHGDCHWPDPTRHWGYNFCDVYDFIKRDIADQFRLSLTSIDRVLRPD